MTPNYQISARFWRGSKVELRSEHPIGLLVKLRACWRLLRSTPVSISR
jgi:hypothetical protein